MRDAYSALESILQLNLQPHFYCVYCGGERASNSGTGGDIDCCGEVGHVVLQYELPPQKEPANG